MTISVGLGLRRALAVTVLVCAVVALAPAARADAPVTGTISGTVTGPGASPLLGVEVTVFDDTEAYFGITDAAGHYSIAGVPAGSYFVQFWPPDGSGLAPFTTADLVLVAEGQTVTVDASLFEYSTLSGTVTGPGAIPVEGVEAFLSGDGVELSVFTDADGEYAFATLLPGEYNLQFLPPLSSGLVPLLYPDPVVVTPASDQVIDVELELGGTISGTADLPVGVDHTAVMVVAFATNWLAFAELAPDGSYSMGGLPSGEYLIVFDTFIGSGLVPEFYDDARTPLGGDFVALASGATVAGIDATLELCEPSFTDVETFSTFCVPIDWLEASGIAGGFPDGTFRPTLTVSRGAMASFLWRRAGAPAGPFDPPGYSDVPPGHVFATPIAWASEEGIIDGFPDGTFRPGAAVSRQAAAAMMWRDAGEPPFPLPPDVCLFVDVCGDHPFAEPIAWMYFETIATGFDDGTFRPTLAVSRQAMASFLFRDQLQMEFDVLFPVPPFGSAAEADRAASGAPAGFRSVLTPLLAGRGGR